MDKFNSTFNLKTALIETYNLLLTKTIAYAPQIISALLLLALGIVVSYLVSTLLKKLVNGFDALFSRMAPKDWVKREKFKNSYATIIGSIVFWSLLLFFITASVNILDWKIFSHWLNKIINYLPNFIGGIIIIMCGFPLSNVVKSYIKGATKFIALEHSRALAKVGQLLILFAIFIIGIEVIGFQAYFIANLLIASLAIAFAGMALAFGLGARQLIANLISAQYCHKYCRLGEEMQINSIKGVIAEITKTCIILKTEEGRVVIPARLFHENISTFYANTEVSKNVKG